MINLSYKNQNRQKRPNQSLKNSVSSEDWPWDLLEFSSGALSSPSSYTSSTKRSSSSDHPHQSQLKDAKMNDLLENSINYHLKLAKDLVVIKKQEDVGQQLGLTCDWLAFEQKEKESLLSGISVFHMKWDEKAMFQSVLEMAMSQQAWDKASLPLPIYLLLLHYRVLFEPIMAPCTRESRKEW